MRKKNVTVYCGASFGVDERYQEVTKKTWRMDRKE